MNSSKAIGRQAKNEHTKPASADARKGKVFQTASNLTNPEKGCINQINNVANSRLVKSRNSSAADVKRSIDRIDQNKLDKNMLRLNQIAESKIQNSNGDIPPPGHTLLPEDERKEAVKMLRCSYSQLVNELNKMPILSTTQKMHDRKFELENQLKKLEQGVKVFSCRKVYVKIGS